jgi:toxin ParE1/3/4
MAVGFSPAALRDLEAIGDHIQADNPKAAACFVLALRARCETIGHAPRSGRPRPELSQDGLRSIAFRRYVIFYTTDGADVRIDRVLHGARDIEAMFDPDET